MQVITIRYYCLCGTLATKQTPYFQSNSEIGRFAFQLKTVSSFSLKPPIFLGLEHVTRSNTHIGYLPSLEQPKRGWK
ncbi:hypothetical protein SDC9_109205 [bioreactor metagenome]|uniref:Uncharacterized protein n=1 Tax=bioreactor metagenome TaxID=1076179 RepID=A0A645BA36_9ZZZZ